VLPSCYFLTVVVVSPLQRRVLVLNRLWQPVHICTAKRAIVLLYLGHAQVVDVEGGSIHGTHDLQSWMDRTSEQVELMGQGWEQSEDDLPLLGTSSSPCFAPSIIVLSFYDRLPKREVRFTRENIFRRDDFTCQYCGQKKEPRHLNIDHVFPRDKGGRHCWENVVASCIPCNTRKGNKLPKDGGAVPKRAPSAPRWRPLGVGDRYNTGVFDKRWSVFVQPNHSEVEISS